MSANTIHLLNHNLLKMSSVFSKKTLWTHIRERFFLPKLKHWDSKTDYSLEKLLSVFGAERTVWGTGYPGHHRQKHNWPSLALELQLIREGLPFLTDDDRERILGGTAAQIWNLAT
ncbi:MAG: amidohydrolase family protein [Candidatus Poribacteria bacterium]|nr:amidohydrolase family protein [Candidatus Poribacteria bacterium]